MRGKTGWPDERTWARKENGNNKGNLKKEKSSVRVRRMRKRDTHERQELETQVYTCTGTLMWPEGFTAPINKEDMKGGRNSSSSMLKQNMIWRGQWFFLQTPESQETFMEPWRTGSFWWPPPFFSVALPSHDISVPTQPLKRPHQDLENNPNSHKSFFLKM